MLWCLSLWTRPCFLLKPLFNIVIKLFLSQFLFWLVLRQLPPQCVMYPKHTECDLCKEMDYQYSELILWVTSLTLQMMLGWIMECAVFWLFYPVQIIHWWHMFMTIYSELCVFLVRLCSTVSFHYNCVAREPSQYIFLKRHVMFCWPQTCLTELSSYLWMYFLQLCHNV